MAKSNNRDEFSQPTKRAIEPQARSHCSNPACRRLTNSATSDRAGEINIGVASHICAAAPGGPRYDASMTPEQRCSADNGIWLCQDHAHAVDAPDSKFTIEEMREWKRLTDEDSWRSIMENVPYGPAMRPPTPDVLRDRLRAVAMLDDLILVAAPGMGKTTTVFQIMKQDARRAAALRDTSGGFHQKYLISLATFATMTANTSITDANARRSVSQTAHALVSDGQSRSQRSPISCSIRS